jgi:hypothetical protein
MESDSDYHSADEGDADKAGGMAIENIENHTLGARRAISMAQVTVSK